ncbi:ATP-binding protein [Flavobacterium sp. SUN052]|uniref:ATP-binding protein n=1 Tax=Flavobacterium sp. SUN052 TaxID=3002441 RepID=UPI00237D9110|nr:ATP-binding protein [Flavobacterium sp. SUN052]MEC4003968.1 ATP-binding protein [Flavobacterium sp. SUN052]
MDTSIKIAIAKVLKNYLVENNFTQSDIVNKTGIRKEFVSIILKENSKFMYDAKGTEAFIHQKYFYILANLCGFETEKKHWQTQPTPQTNAILANLTDAKKYNQTITIIGETGCGKTHTANLFTAKNSIDTFLVTAGSSDNLNDLLDKILEELKTHSTGGSKSTKIRWIARRFEGLKTYGHKPMLIIDESEYLRQTSLCAMKEIYDNIHEFCSIVFIGTDQLIENIELLKRRNKSGIPQFQRRVKFGLRILPSIDRTFKQFIGDIEDIEFKKFLLINCKNYGELHDVIVPVSIEAERLNVSLDMQLVRKVLNLPEGNLIW